MKKILYSSIQEQLNKLASQGLSIPNTQYAFTALFIYGYSNIIKGYRDPYVYHTDDGVKYRDGVSFEQILSLYLLDKNLRNSVMAVMLDLEEYIKETAATVIAQSFGTDPNDYLVFSKYQNKRKRLERFSLSGLLNKMKATLLTGTKTKL